MSKKIGLFLLFQWFYIGLLAQTTDALPTAKTSQKEVFEIGGINITGANHSDEKALLAVAGLRVGDKIKIPGYDLQRAIKNLLKLRLFKDVQIFQEKTIGSIIFLELLVVEMPRLSRYSFKGVKKTDHDDLNALIGKIFLKGVIVTENMKINAQEKLKVFYAEKGYADVAIQIVEKHQNNKTNTLQLIFNIQKGSKTKVNNIMFSGNKNISNRKLKRLMMTKERRNLLKTSKFQTSVLAEDKKSIISYYESMGYLDAKIVADTIWQTSNSPHRNIQLTIEEGQQYYFGNIVWEGNEKYSTKKLIKVLGIKKGDIYNPHLLENRLHFSPDGSDIKSLYMDDGYLFFQINPEITSIDNDQLDLKIRIFEGAQATIGKVIIKGNDRTNEAVIRREIRTKPGEKFSRSDIIRSQREIINLGYFNPESLGINTSVNPQQGTVDVEYIVEERNSDQLELSAGWGGGDLGVTGTLGITFNNFSFRNLLKGEAWNPLPAGDGQRLSFRIQSNGDAYQSINLSFTEPWLGGKKPQSLTFATYFNRYTNGLDKASDGFGLFSVLGGSVSLATRLKWPDDNFISTTAVNFERYHLQNWSDGSFQTKDGQLISQGQFYNLNIKQTIARSTVNHPIFPTEGSKISLSAQFTPPYSLFSDSAENATTAEGKFKLLEYQKWRFDSEFYTALTGKLVLKVGAKFGFLGGYNSALDTPPFGRFQLGGDGLSNGGFTGTDIISLRGYEVEDLENNLLNGSKVATPIYQKLSMELRYPLSLNPNMTAYALAFFDAGNSFQSFSRYNPFDLKRSAGLGLRVFLPMFGTLGFDYGIGFDKAGTGRNWQGLGKFSLIIGFEPE